jgi:hypothetical protein
MHFSHVVALDGSLHEDQVSDALEWAMMQFHEENDEAISGEWDWYVVGGRWGSEWTLRDGAPTGPLGTEPSTFGFTKKHEENPRATDCARWQHIVPESVKVPYSWLDLSLRWHTKWLGPDASGSNDTKDWERGSDHDEEFMKFLAYLPVNTWLVHVDFHS